MRLRLALSLGLFGALAACVNLPAVQDYAKASAGIASYTKATTEFGQRYESTAAYVSPSEQAARKAASERRKDALPDLLSLNAQLKEYMEVLAKLAGADSFDVSAPAGRLQTAISENPTIGLTKEVVASYGSIGQIISKWALSYAQQQAVRQLVTDANPDVQTLLAGMRHIVGLYKLDLQQERRDVEAVYKLNREFLDRTSDRLLAVLAADHFAAKTKAFDVRETQLAELEGALAKVAAGHADLAKNVNHLSGAELTATLKALAQDIWKAKGQLEGLNK